MRLDQLPHQGSPGPLLQAVGLPLDRALGPQAAPRVTIEGTREMKGRRLTETKGWKKNPQEGKWKKEGGREPFPGWL